MGWRLRVGGVSLISAGDGVGSGGVRVGVVGEGDKALNGPWEGTVCAGKMVAI